MPKSKSGAHMTVLVKVTPEMRAWIAKVKALAAQIKASECPACRANRKAKG